jgi:hypothetical protein
MKNLLLLLILCSLVSVARAQESMEKMMENRAREMYRVILLSDKDAWRKFIEENYTQKFIDKPMKSTVQATDSGSGDSINTEATTASSLEDKVNMYGVLHTDFQNSKITSIKQNGESVEMIAETTNGMKGIFTLKFDTTAPYLIDGMGIQVELSN